MCSNPGRKAYESGCRCDGCRADNARRSREYRRRKGIRPLSPVDGNGRIYPHMYVVRDNGCWEWQYNLNTGGYGRVGLSTGTILAHRYMFNQVHGYYPPVVRHTCDNPPCVNPDHLVAGTQRDNVRDMHERGRSVKVSFSGESHPRAKLTLDQVREMRYRYQQGETQKSLAEEFGISTSQASNICSGRQWGLTPGA